MVGLSAATVLAKRGHNVTLYEAQDKIGGQFNYAKIVPGKEEFYQTIRYLENLVTSLNINLVLNHKVTKAELEQAKFDDVDYCHRRGTAWSTNRRRDLPQVISYAELLSGKQAGQKVAVIGAGGIGFDVSEFLTSQTMQPFGKDSNGNPVAVPHPQSVESWKQEWGVDTQGNYQPRVG